MSRSESDPPSISTVMRTSQGTVACNPLSGFFSLLVVMSEVIAFALVTSWEKGLTVNSRRFQPTETGINRGVGTLKGSTKGRSVGSGSPTG